jgi:hypothetical protein
MIQVRLLDITSADTEGLIRHVLSLRATQSVNASLTVTGPGASSKVLPKFYLQSISVQSDKHEGTCVRIRCTSINPKTPYRLQRKSQSFPLLSGDDDTSSTTLKDIATQIAKESKC